MYEDLMSAISKNDTFAIYGAGNNGIRLSKLLDKAGVNVDCFIVSDDSFKKSEKEAWDKSILTLKEWSVDNARNKIVILVAVDEKYKEEVIKNLESEKKDYYYISKEDYYYLNIYIYRKENPYDVNTFLISPEPVSSCYGFDRGTPVDRYYIKDFLKRETCKLNTVKSILEVGADTYSSLFFPDNLIKKDILYYVKGMDLTKKETLKEDGYDLFICTQVFHVIYDIRAAIEGAIYTLKPDGVLLATVAGSISQVDQSLEYGDYWRLTDISAKLLFSEYFNDVEVAAYGNAATATAFIQGITLEELPDSNIFHENNRKYSIVIGIKAQNPKIE